jgi:hypothetical protein
MVNFRASSNLPASCKLARELLHTHYVKRPRMSYRFKTAIIAIVVGKRRARYGRGGIYRRIPVF